MNLALLLHIPNMCKRGPKFSVMKRHMLPNSVQKRYHGLRFLEVRHFVGIYAKLDPMAGVFSDAFRIELRLVPEFSESVSFNKINMIKRQQGFSTKERTRSNVVSFIRSMTLRDLVTSNIMTFFFSDRENEKWNPDSWALPASISVTFNDPGPFPSCAMSRLKFFGFNVISA